jgi:hypothetical protein
MYAIMLFVGARLRIRTDLWQNIFQCLFSSILHTSELHPVPKFMYALNCGEYVSWIHILNNPNKCPTQLNNLGSAKYIRFYLEHHSVWSLVGIGIPPPPSPASERLPHPLHQKKGVHLLADEGVGVDKKPSTLPTLWYEGRGHLTEIQM